MKFCLARRTCSGVGGFDPEGKHKHDHRPRVSRTYSEESTLDRWSHSQSGEDDASAYSRQPILGKPFEYDVFPRRLPQAGHSGSAPIRRMTLDPFKTKDELPAQPSPVRERGWTLQSKFSDSSADSAEQETQDLLQGVHTSGLGAKQ